MAISIRTSNFGWAHPNRVVSQAVFQKFAAGHPKFGAEREVRAPTLGTGLAELGCTLGWPSQWRFQIPAQIHPKFIFTVQPVVIKKTHSKIIKVNHQVTQ